MAPMMNVMTVDMVSPFIEVDGSHYRTCNFRERPIHHVRCIGERLVILGYGFKSNAKILEDELVSKLACHLVLGSEGELEEFLVVLLLPLHSVGGGERKDAECASNSVRERDLDRHDLVLSGGVGSHYGTCIF
nr:MAG TPA: hypothetical protein [Caudoviricetes sp.]